MTDEIRFLVHEYGDAFTIRTNLYVRYCTQRISRVPGMIATVDDDGFGINMNVQDGCSPRKVITDVLKALCDFYDIRHPQVEGIFEEDISRDIERHYHTKKERQIQEDLLKALYKGQLIGQRIKKLSKKLRKLRKRRQDLDKAS